jgi:hypothetical protein
MIPRSPVIEGREEDEVQLGAEQDEFQTLPALTFRDHEGVKSLSRWELEEGEREELLRTGSIFVSQITGGGAPRPILPSVFPPDIPEQAAEPEGHTLEGEGVESLHVEPVIFEFRMVALDRDSGNPVSGVEGGARLFVDLTTLAAQFATSGQPTGDASEVISRQLETLARVLAGAYGADVYFRLYASASARWHVVEGKLEDGAHMKRTIHAGNSGRLPADIDAAILDTGAAGVGESIQMVNLPRLERRKASFEVTTLSGRKRNLIDVQPGAGRTLKIYLRGLLHLSITTEVFAIQSWLNDDYTLFSIEYSTRDGAVLTEYTDRALWADILRLLDNLEW